MDKLRLLDLYCKAGGAGMGYHNAGYEVVGVDIEPQPHYPFEFHQADALEYLSQHWREFDVIHASPVCKGYSRLACLNPQIKYPDQVGELRKALKKYGKPYVIENVEGAPLEKYVKLCGSMFGLRVYRHRLFECNPEIYFSPGTCNHWGKTQPAANKSTRTKAASLKDYDFLSVTGHDFIVKDAQRAMGIDWMTGAELSQAIPPAYTEYIGAQMMINL